MELRESLCVLLATLSLMLYPVRDPRILIMESREQTLRHRYVPSYNAVISLASARRVLFARVVARREGQGKVDSQAVFFWMDGWMDGVSALRAQLTDE